MAGVDKLEDKVMNLSKDVRQQYIAQKLKEVQKGRAENQAMINQVAQKFDRLEKIVQAEDRIQPAKRQTQPNQSLNNAVELSSSQGKEVHFSCRRNECIQDKAEIIELKNRVRELTRDNELYKRELEENSYWIDSQFALQSCVDQLQRDNNNLQRYLQQQIAERTRQTSNASS